jgi:hypothetical protein
MLTHILLGIAAIAGWALFTLASPVARCRRCHGKRIIRTRLARKIRKCPRCKGAGRASRLGAVLTHRAAWSLLGDHVRRRIGDRHHQTEDPK